MPLVDIEGYGVEVDFPDSMSDADIAAAIQRDVIPRLQQSQPDSSPRGVLESMSTPERAQVMMHARNGATDLNDALYRMAAERGLDLPNAAPQEKLEALRALEFAPAVPQSTGVAPGKALPAGMDAERLTASPYGIPATPERSGLVPASDSEKYFQSPGGQAEAMRYLARISDPAHQAADIVLEALGVSQGETAGMDPEMKGQLIDVIGGGQNRGFPRQDTAMSSGGIGRDAALFLRSLAAQAAEGVGAGRISPDTPGLGALSRFATDTPRDESNFAVGLAGQVSPLFDPTAKLAMGGVAKAIAPLIRRLPAAAQIPILGAAQLGAFGLHQEGARQIDAGDFGAVELGKATAHSAALGAIVSPAHFIAEPGARLLAESMLFGSGGAILEGRKPETGDYLSALAFMGAMGIAHGAPLEAVRKRMRGQRPTSEEAEALEKVLPEVREAAAPWFGRSGGKIDIPAVEEMLSRPADLGRERPLRTVQQITAESRERERRDRSADEGRRMMARRREEALAQDEAARAKITPETAPEMTDADLVRWMAKEPQGSEVRAILAKELDRRTPPPGEPPPGRPRRRRKVEEEAQQDAP